MGTILKGLQSVLIALGIIAIVGTGVVLYYNTVKPEDEEQVVVAETEADPALSETETEETAEVDEDDSETEEDTDENEHRTSYIEGHEHTYKSSVIKPSTCTEPGEVKYTCYCGDTYVDAIKVKDHTPGSWITMRAATDSQTGLKQKCCIVCGKVLEEETIPMLTSSSSNSKNSSKNSTSDHTHSYTYEISTEPTCTEKGEKTYTCTYCGSTFETSIPATNHPSRRTVRTEGDCSEPGKIETVCNICDAVISSEDLYYEHDWGDWEITTQPTSTAKGEKTRTCEECGETETKSISKTSGTSTVVGSTNGTVVGGDSTCSHKYNSSITVNATCTSAGTTLYTCSLCGAYYTEAEPEALGHLAGNWTIIKKATTTEEGERVKYCTRCGEIAQTEIIAKVTEQHKHSYTVSVVTQPTCGQTGTRQYTCSSCGYYYTASIPATGGCVDSDGNGRCDVCNTKK